jgi:hypothetical protein
MLFCSIEGSFLVWCSSFLRSVERGSTEALSQSHSTEAYNPWIERASYEASTYYLHAPYYRIIQTVEFVAL